MLLGCKPGKHKDKREKRLRKEATDDILAAKHRKWVLAQARLEEQDY